MRVICGVLVSALWISACAPESDAPFVAATRRAPSSDGDHVVTLLTGDRVRVVGEQVSVTPGPGREGTSFHVAKDRERIMVIPADVAPRIGTELDPALFDVAKLIADGVADDARDDVPLIVTGVDPAAFAPRLAGEVVVERALPALHMMVVRQPKARAGAVLRRLVEAPRLKGAPSARIWLDAQLALTLDHSVPQIGGDVAHARGFTGAGVTIAVIDSGIDVAHPDFAGKLDASEEFVGDGLGVSDVFGHGTHVASIAAGTGAASGGTFAGVAPDARLISARACNAAGRCPTSATLAAMQWAVVDRGAKIINVSLGGTDSEGIDPLEQAVNELSAQYGALFVVAAGNTGGEHTVASPGSADAALTVGAVDRDNQRAAFSSRGPRIGDGAIKPDVTAPGVDIVAARASGVPDIGTPVDDAYQVLSGTSMATPHTAGAAALLLQQHPDWSGAQLKAQLIGTAAPTAGLTAFEQGAGRIDVDRATRQTVLATPPSISLGIASFPHDDDPTLVRTVTYHNDGNAPLVLALDAAMTGPDGAALSVALSASSLTVPAGGDARVDVTATTRGALPDGNYAGALTATAGDARIVTPIALVREPPSHALTIELIGHDGAPDAGLISLHTPTGLPLIPIDGRVTLRLPDARYGVAVNTNRDFLSYPHLVLASDTTITLDAREAGLVEPDVGDPTVALQSAILQLVDRPYLQTDLVLGGPGMMAASFGPDAPPGEITSLWSVAYTDNLYGPARKIYNLARADVVRGPTGWTDAIPRDAFATVEVRGAGTPDDAIFVGLLPVFVGSDGDVEPLRGTTSNTYIGPYAYTEYDAGTGFQWQRRVDYAGPDFFSLSTLESQRSYLAGHRYAEREGLAPAGPALPSVLQFDATHNFIAPPARRSGDLLTLRPTLFGSADRRAAYGALWTFDTDHVALSREGVELFAQDQFFFNSNDALEPIEVPAAPARYRFARDVTRSNTDLSTEVHAAWTFRSQHVAHGDQPLPLLAMRFQPPLDDTNTARSRLMVMPIAFEHQDGAQPTPVLDASLETSFDDGATWSRVPVAALGDRGLAVFFHPPGARYVSLRGRATDLAGSKIEQTIVHAYRVRVE